MSRDYLKSIPNIGAVRATDPRVLEYAMRVVTAEEGFRSRAYRDRGGRWTIGYGRTDGVREGDVTTERAERAWTAARLSQILRRLQTWHPDPLPVPCWAALASWVYNIGEAAAEKSTLRKRIREGRLDLVDDELLRWRYSRDETGAKSVDPVLQARRRAEAQLWNTGLDELRSVAVAGDTAVPQSVAGAPEAEPVDPLSTGTGRTAAQLGAVGAIATVAQTVAAAAPGGLAGAIAIAAVALIVVVAVLIIWMRGSR